MRVVITGAGGQVGQALIQTVPAKVEVMGLGKQELDITDPQSTARALDQLRPEVIVNAAAYTKVDQAEVEYELAFRVNASAASHLAAYCAARGSRLIQLSTDFVFDGTSSTPYLPEHPTNPINVYGASKREAEATILQTPNLDWRIVRTAWVYGVIGTNFLLTMLRLFAVQPTVRVVADQVGTPTSARSLARCVWAAVQDTRGPPKIFHFTDAGVASWYDFAIAIYEEARTLGVTNNTVDIVPIRSSEYPSRARRPAYSVLEKAGTLDYLGLPIQHWRSVLREVVGGLQAP